MNSENTASPTPTTPGPATITFGSRVKFIQRNVFFVGYVVDIEHVSEPRHPVKVPIQDAGGTLIATATVEPAPLPEYHREILWIAVPGYREPCRIFKDSVAPVA